MFSFTMSHIAYFGLFRVSTLLLKTLCDADLSGAMIKSFACLPLSFNLCACVYVQVKPAEEFHGVIVVIGPEDDVISCCQYIEQQVGLLSQEQNHREKLRFSMTIDIPAKHQKKLVGKKGMKVS